MAEKPRHHRESENTPRHDALDNDATPPLSPAPSEKPPPIPPQVNTVPVSSIQDNALREVSAQPAAGASTQPPVESVSMPSASSNVSIPPPPNQSNPGYDAVQAQNTREHYLHDNYYPYLYHDEWYVNQEQYSDSASQNYLHDNYYPHVYHDEWYQRPYDYQDSHPAAPFVGTAPGGGAAPFVASATPFFAGAAAASSFEGQQGTPQTTEQNIEPTPSFEPGTVSAQAAYNPTAAPSEQIHTGLENETPYPSPSSPLSTAGVVHDSPSQLYQADALSASPVPLYSADSFSPSPLVPSTSFEAAQVTEPPSYLQPTYSTLQSDAFPVTGENHLANNPALPIQQAQVPTFSQEERFSSHASQTSPAEQVQPLPLQEQSVQPMQPLPIQEQPGAAFPGQPLLQYEPWNELNQSFIEQRDEFQQPLASTFIHEETPTSYTPWASAANQVHLSSIPEQPAQPGTVLPEETLLQYESWNEVYQPFIESQKDIRQPQMPAYFHEETHTPYSPWASGADQAYQSPIQEQPGAVLPEHSPRQYAPQNELQPSFAEHRDEFLQPLASTFAHGEVSASYTPWAPADEQVHPSPNQEQSVQSMQPLPIQDQLDATRPEHTPFQSYPLNELQPSFVEHQDEFQQPYMPPLVQEETPIDFPVLVAPTAQQELIGNQAAESLVWDAYATEDGMLHTSKLGTTQFLIQDAVLDGAVEGGEQSLAWSIVNVSDASQPQVLLQGESTSLPQAKADLLIQSQAQGYLETERIESFLTAPVLAPERINETDYLIAPQGSDVMLPVGIDTENLVTQNATEALLTNIDIEADTFVSQNATNSFFTDRDAAPTVLPSVEDAPLTNIHPMARDSHEPVILTDGDIPISPLYAPESNISESSAAGLLENEPPLLMAEGPEAHILGSGKASLTENAPPLPEHSPGVFGLIDKEAKAASPISGTPQHSAKEKLSKVGAAAAAGTLGVLGFASNIAKKTAAYTGEAAITGVNQILREDEDLAKLANSSDVVRDAVSTELARHAKQVKHRDARHFLVKTRAENKQELLDDARENFKEAAIPASASVFEMATPAQSETEKITALKHSKEDLVLPDKGETVEQSLTPKKDKTAAIRKEAGAKSDEAVITSASEKDGARIADNESSVLEFVGLDKEQLDIKQRGGQKHSAKKDKEKPSHKQLKKKEGQAKGDASNEKDGFVLKDPRQGAAAGLVGGVAGTALAATNIAKDSTLRVIASENEEIAVLLSAVDTTKKTYKNIKRVARIPVKVYRAVRAVAHAVYRAGAAIWKALCAVAAAGWPAILCLLGLFFVVIAVVVILLGTATIINDDQETSEVAALVAELDAELTEEINNKGAAPVLYADGRDTYLEEDGEGGSLTIDVDLSDEESDLESVSASSITVQTNPDEIIAYIDARYGGEWQVGAASWKYTVDAFGKTWTVFDWDSVPEWVQKGLNKIGKIDFALSLQMELEQYLGSEIEGIDPDLVQEIADDVSDQIADVVYDGQVSDMSEELLIQIMRDTVKQHQGELELSDESLKKIYYEMLGSITEMVGEEEPVALVYDEIVLLHERMNFWSEDYESIPTTSGGATGGQTGSGPSTTMNASGYPNTNGYDAAELANWDGYNEVSRYGIGEPGTTAVLGDGTQITNTWSGTTMAIACEGKQNNLYAYWTKDYRDNTGISDPTPVRITLFNSQTNMTVTVEVRDCGGWRGFNKRYEGLNQDRQWDLLPAVWRALGGTESSGLMNVYWKVESGAGTPGTAGALAPVTIEGYPWPAETDAEDGNIEINLPAYVPHGIQDVLSNDPLLEELLDREAFASDREYKMAYNTVYGKVRTIMRGLLTQTNAQETVFIDYFYLRRDLGNPFGKDENRRQHQWIVTHRYNPGYENFDHDEAYVKIKPITGATSVYAIAKGVVTDVSEDSVTISHELDTTTDAVYTYSGLKNIKVDEDDELKRGAALGTLSGSGLTISYYETETKNFITFDRDWAYAASLFMDGFAGYEEPDEPSPYTGAGARSYEDCETIVEFAHSRLGCPYVTGATGPDTFDCSGLTQWCYAQSGISIPRTSTAQHAAAVAQGGIVPLDESLLQPGDILWKPGHVAIYIGNNQYIHAPQTGDVVKISTGINYFSQGLSLANENA